MTAATDALLNSTDAAWGVNPPKEADEDGASYFSEAEEYFSWQERLVTIVNKELTKLNLVPLPSSYDAGAEKPAEAPPLPKDMLPPPSWQEEQSGPSDPSLRLRTILDKYREIPNLLDPFLERMVSPLAEYLRASMTIIEDMPVPKYRGQHARSFCQYIGSLQNLQRPWSKNSGKDTIEDHLPAYIQWCATKLSEPSSLAFFRLQSWTRSVKFINWDLAFASSAPRFAFIDLHENVCGNDGEGESACEETFDKVVSESWIVLFEAKGSHSLSTNLRGAGSNVPSKPSEVPADADDEDDLVPAEIEEVVEALLLGLRDKDTIVRWSAAKGIGRIASRLTQDLAGEVVESVKMLLCEDVFGVPQTGELDIEMLDGWMCRLTRRGLLMPSALPGIIPWILLALRFDIRKGTYSIGSHVRDAACYVCWSFARAYDSQVLLPYTPQLSRCLAVVSTLDREVNVRRAASAALQECVGRLGTAERDGDVGVPHGIDVITLADYFAVGNRSAAALEVAVEVARFLPYQIPIVKYASTAMTTHWDKEIRELGSKSLARLTDIARDEAVDCSTHTDLVVRHGSILAVAEVCLALSKGWKRYPKNYLDSFGSDLTVTALCHLVQCLCESGWPDASTTPRVPAETIMSWTTLLDASLERREEAVQAAASSAYASLLSYKLRLGLDVTGDVESLCKRVQGVEDVNLNAWFRRRGCVVALGGMPVGCLGSEEGVMAVATVLEKMYGDEIVGDVPEATLESACDLLLVCVEDYSIDQRGDVGSWVREACFRAWALIIPAVLRPSSRERGGTLRKLLEGGWFASWGGEFDKVLEGDSDSMNWLNPAQVYPLMVPLLAHDFLRRDLMLGLVVSVGGISESLVRQSTSSFVAFANSLPLTSDTDLTLIGLLESFQELFDDDNLPMGKETRERVSASLLEVCDVLIGCGAIGRAVEEGGWTDGALKLFEKIKREVFEKFGGFATIPGDTAKSVREKALSTTVGYLAHPTTEREGDEGMTAEAEEVVLTTDWDLPVAELKPVRQTIADLLGVKLAVAAKKA
ncbi:armadillo-type protein [Chytridium lagenaria]|nr:armadillo-type protein [Chytridium lagenaria]